MFHLIAHGQRRALDMHVILPVWAALSNLYTGPIAVHAGLYVYVHASARSLAANTLTLDEQLILPTATVLSSLHSFDCCTLCCSMSNNILVR